jgi:hypothetical protein
MYRVNKKTKYRNWIVPLLLLVAVASLLFGAGVWIKNDVGTVITKQDGASIRHVGTGEGKVTFDEPYFKITTPSDWKLYQKSASPLTYYFKNTKKNADDRNLVLYVDADTKSYAVNRVLPVSADGKKLVTGEISDTCANFAGPGADSAQEAQSQADVIARWQNVSFLCDLSHANRNAIGLSSSEGINTVTLKGRTGAHSYFLLYTDHNIRPDFSLVDEIFSSLEAK